LKLYPPVAAAADLESTGSGRSSNPVGSMSVLEGRGIQIDCGGESQLILEKESTLQLEGRKRLPVAEFLRGHPIEPGTKLG
jgi:methionyl-tRNA formyltransferase